MNTPIYNELVAKYYLSKGVRPFSNEPIEWEVSEKPLGYFDLSAPSNLVDNPSFEVVTEGELDTVRTYNYFRL